MNHIASNGPTPNPVEAIENGFLFYNTFFRHLTCLVTPYEDALSLGHELFQLRRDMLCQGVNVWTKNLNDFRVLCLLDTLRASSPSLFGTTEHGNSLK